MQIRAAFLMLALSCCVLARGQEWTRFRGPNGTGISEAKTIPTKISDADLNWKIEMPGAGHSSPVLWGERLFITSAGPGGGFSALCYHAKTGSLLWRHDFPLRPFAKHKFNSFASSTPAVDAERVYVVWNEPEHFRLAALTHEGKPVWERDFGPFMSQHGCGISPIVFEGKVILGNEQDDVKFAPEDAHSGKSFIVAIDARDGQTLWQTPRKSVVVAYSTPCIYQPKGRGPEIIFNSQGHGIYSVDPDSGRVIWSFERAFDKRSVSSPFVAGDLVYGSCGSGGGGNYLVAVRAGDAAHGRKAELAYYLKKSAPYVPTGIALGNSVWLWSDAGIVTCLDAPSGKVQYQERVGGNFFGSPIWVEGRLFCVSTAGELAVVEASDRFQVLHRYPLKELCHSTPAAALGRLFIRTEKHLWSFGGPVGERKRT